ncbi:MbtH family NRPS accessory protein [Lentzea pudingi]|nr:MbtH family NRPS accessory protein [Lentzea pudingi]
MAADYAAGAAEWPVPLGELVVWRACGVRGGYPAPGDRRNLTFSWTPAAVLCLAASRGRVLCDALDRFPDSGTDEERTRDDQTFQRPDGTFLVLVNGEGKHSLWPEFATLPSPQETPWSGKGASHGAQRCLVWTSVTAFTLSRARTGAVRIIMLLPFMCERIRSQ